jgi:S-adenosylmethionine uptake transporter
MASPLSSANGRGALFALAAFAIYSTHDVVVKILGGIYSPFQVIFFSTLFGFPVITVMMIRDKEDGNLRPRHPWLILLRTTLMVTTAASVFYAFSVLPLAQTYAIIFAAPLLITVLAIPVLGERVGWRRLSAVAVGLLGVLVVLRPGATPLTLGHAAALAGAVCSAGAAVIVRKIGAEERSAVLLLYPMMANFLVAGSILPFVYEPMPAVHLGGSATMAVMGFTAALCQIVAYRSASAGVVAPMQYSQILWATLYGALFFAETPDSNTAIGAAIIIASGMYVVFREERPSVSRTSPVTNTQTRYAVGTIPRISALSRLFRKPDAES